MKNIIKKLLAFISVFLFLFTVVSCAKDEKCTAHTDADKNAICDVCGSAVDCEECVDTDGNQKCDVCGKDIQKGAPCETHVDYDKNARCDVCGAAVKCEECVDADENEKCDVCGKDIQKGASCVAHVDYDKNARCDVCGATLECEECVDNDENKKCDVCGKDVKNSLVLSTNDGITYTIILAKDTATDVRTYVSKNIIEVLRGMGVQAKALTEGSNNDVISDVEILIGGVENRGEEYRSTAFYLLGENGYEIKLAGTKVIINGGSADALLYAVEKFTSETLLPVEGVLSPVIMTSDKEEKVVQTEFDIDNLTIDGVKITSGSISTDINSKDFVTAAKTIQSALYKKAGIWLPIKDASADDAVISIVSIPRVYSDESFTISTDGGCLIIKCAFANKLNSMTTTFTTNNISAKKGDVAFSGEITRYDISFVTYEDFGAKGDGVTDDFAAINNAHNFANESGQTVLGTPGKTYYIFNTGGAVTNIKTNVDWRGAAFIIDDREISSISGGKNHYLGESHIFKVARDDDLDVITAGEEIRTALCAAGLRPDTKEIDLSILGVEGPVMIIPYNSTHKVFRRRNYGAWAGSSMHECIVIDENGRISDDTPIMFNYSAITTLYIYPLDESSALTIENATFTTRASQTNTLNTKTGNTKGSYINRGLTVNRSYTTVKNVKHYVTDELTLDKQVDSDGNIIACGAIYHGFFNASYANEVTFENCVLTGRRCYPTQSGGADGTYDISATLVNKVVFKNCTQSNFWVKVDDNLRIVPANEGDEGARLSMSSYTVNGKSLKMHWGIGGTNYCKNMEYIGSTLSRLDAHAGLYNGKIIDSTVNYISLVGCGSFTVENSRWFAEGSGEGSNSLLHLRNDYGSTWNGTITVKNVKAYTYTSSKSYVFYHKYTNWYYGYTCHLPNLDIDNLEFYNIKTGEALPEGYEIYLTGTSIYAGTKKHLDISHTRPYFETYDRDGDGKIDETLYDRNLDGIIDAPYDLDGDGIIGNTSIDYTGTAEKGVQHPTSYVNLNIVVPPEFIKFKNNNQGIVYRIANTADGVTSDGGYYNDTESYGGFFGGTKFYYSEEEYFLGSDHEGQTLTGTIKFYK